MEVFSYVWYTFVRDGLEYIRYEFLVWSPHEADYEATLSGDGKNLYFNSKISKTFLNMLRVSTQYQAVVSFNNEGRLNNPCFQAAKKQYAAVKSFFDLEDIKPMVDIQLPFQVHPNFICPYDPDMARTLQKFPHEDNPPPTQLDQDQQDALAACPQCHGVRKAEKVVNIYICSMQNITVAREEATTTTASHHTMV